MRKNPISDYEDAAVRIKTDVLSLAVEGLGNWECVDDR